MDTAELDNPIWSSLRSRHRAFARAHGELLRYPPDIAPFLGVPQADLDATVALDALVQPGERVYLLGPAPRVPSHFESKPPVALAQMICTRPLPEPAGPDFIELTEPHRADVLALAALVYPHYFRPRTPLLGRYFGIYADGCLAAMIGERMGTAAWREVSAVCTHPDHGGRGHARRLLAWLSNDILARGMTPFLHVSPQNRRALELYERSGYRTRREIAFRALRRADVAG